MKYIVPLLLGPLLVAAFAGLFTPGKFHGWGWLMGFLLVYYALFLPKSTVVIVDKLGSQPPVAVGNVPIGVAFFGHATSKVGDVMTRFFETAFQVIPATNAQLPGELAYQKNGVMFGNRLIQASRAANVADPQLRTDLIAFVHNCTVYDLQDGTIDPAAFARSTDIWSLMGTPNPARFTTYGNPVQVDTCPNAYTYLAARLPAEVAHARSILAFQLNPTLEPAAALTAIDAQVEQAYYKTKIATAAQGAADLLRQNIMINLVQDSRSLAGQKLNDPAALMIATARANATASVNSAFLTMGKIAEQALPLVRNVIEAVIYAVFPFVFLLFLLAQGRGLAMAIKSFAMSLVWIQLWPPLYAILNYVATLASARNLEAAAKMGTVAQGLALETAASIYSGAVSDQAIAGYMVISIPIIATAIIKGGEVAFQAVTGVGAVQSAASGEAASTSKGSITQNAVSMDQQQLAPTRSSAFMSTTSDAYGTTIQGSGPDAEQHQVLTAGVGLDDLVGHPGHGARDVMAVPREVGGFLGHADAPVEVGCGRLGRRNGPPTLYREWSRWCLPRSVVRCAPATRRGDLWPKVSGVGVGKGLPTAAEDGWMNRSASADDTVQHPARGVRSSTEEAPCLSFAPPWRRSPPGSPSPDCSQLRRRPRGPATVADTTRTRW